MSKEFEYSVVIDDATDLNRHYRSLQPSLTEEQTLSRRIYKNGHGMMARSTRTADGESSVALLDFKQDTPDDVAIKHVAESEPLAIENVNEVAVAGLLGYLGYDLDVELEKTRTSYHFDEFQVDIDEYTAPREAVVFELEGEPDAVRAEQARLASLGLLPPNH